MGIPQLFITLRSDLVEVFIRSVCCFNIRSNSFGTNEDLGVVLKRTLLFEVEVGFIGK